MTIHRDRETGTPSLEHEWKALLRRWGIPVPAGMFLPCAEGRPPLPEGIRRLRPPLVLKAVSPAIVHKSEAGAVRLGIADVDALSPAIDDMLGGLAARKLLPIAGLLVEEMAEPGVELALGMVSDREFGRLFAFGVGGTMVEALGEMRFFAVPLRPFDVGTVLASLPWLQDTLGRRGPAGAAALRDIIWRFAGPRGLALDSRLVAVEINPVIVGPTGAWAVDARGRAAPGEP